MNNDYSHYNQPISSFSSPLQLNKNQHGDQTVNGGHEYTNQLEGQVKDTGEKIIISSQESFEELGQMDLVDSFDSPIEGEILKTKAEEPLSFDDDDFDSFDSFETDDGWGNLEEKMNIVEDKETTVIFKGENQKAKAEVVEEKIEVHHVDIVDVNEKAAVENQKIAVENKKVEVETQIDQQMADNIDTLKEMFEGCDFGEGVDVDKLMQNALEELKDISDNPHEAIELAADKLLNHVKGLSDEKRQEIKEKLVAHFTQYAHVHNPHLAILSPRDSETNKDLTSDKTRHQEIIHSSSKEKVDQRKEKETAILNGTPLNVAAFIRLVSRSSKDLQVMMMAKIKEARNEESTQKQVADKADLIKQQTLKKEILNEEILKGEIKHSILKNKIVQESTKTTTFLETVFVKTIENGKFTLLRRSQEMLVGRIKIYSAIRT
ncbi:hypothetical protein [Candidatus Protochlamydia amoebophila]|uniref:hypothetical protein n=1 Tax=Candidatus Protochlamydia amoebophila TaxID=362787 RepID=UPI001BC8DD22|nr:hypothetical protein [Candidatus Protochlamydia amoebophila]